MTASETPTGPIELRELLALLRANAALFAGTVVATLAAGALYVTFAPPEYEANALVQVETENKGMSALLGEVGELLGAQASVAAELEIIESRLVLDPVIDELGLLDDDGEVRDRDQVTEELVDALEVAERGKQSGIIGVRYRHADPERAAAVINGLLRAYLQQNVERRSAEAEQSLQFLEGELPKLRAGVDAAESALNAYRLRQGSADLTTETELILQQGVALETQRQQLAQQRQALLQRVTASHPSVQMMDAQLRQIARDQEAMLTRVQGLPATQQELLRLARDVEINTGIYMQLLNNVQELRLARAGTVGNVRIVDYARVPTQPASAGPVLVMGVCAALSAVLGLLMVYARRALQHGVDDPGMVERRLGLPTYATVPYSPAQRRLRAEGVLAQRETNDPAIEALRSLRTSLHFALMESRTNVVVLTGPSPGLGKSFVTLNLGAVLAESGKRVVVVDADLRKGRLHECLGLARAPGLADVVAGGADLAQVCHASGVAGLHVVPTGTLPVNATTVLMDPRFGATLKELSRQFDHVLIDTPPVLAVTDATIIARLGGSTLLVLKAGEHPLRAIEDAVRRIKQGGAEVRGSIFNQVGRGGAGYAYAYTYDYRPKKGVRSI